ncbi:MAG: flavin reductase [Bacteroidales bacterium]|nr:flavin reductase [Bacteroidales bacterium]
MKEADISVLGAENQFDLIGREWMLITAGTKESFNTMTASWGGFGWLWNRPVAFVFVRPERYTHDFIEKSDRLTLSVYPEQYRKALQICGSKSGRDCDKVAEAGLTPEEVGDGVMTFAEARMTIQARKLFKSEMTEEEFLDKDLFTFYGKVRGGFHTVYVVEIEKVFTNE